MHDELRAELRRLRRTQHLLMGMVVALGMAPIALQAVTLPHTFVDGTVADREMLPDALRILPVDGLNSASCDREKSAIAPLWLTENRAIEEAIRHCGGNIPKAAGLGKARAGLLNAGFETPRQGTAHVQLKGNTNDG